MRKNGVGRAARRRAQQAALAAARAERNSALQLTEMRVTETEIAAAAVHEAAHVVAGFHWDVPMGKAGVSLTPGRHDVAGFSDNAWTQLPNNHETWYASHVATLIAPFAEFTYRDNNDHGFNWERLVSASRLDFAEIASATNPEHSPEKVSLEQQMNWGRLCFLLWFKQEPEQLAGRKRCSAPAEPTPAGSRSPPNRCGAQFQMLSGLSLDGHIEPVSLPARVPNCSSLPFRPDVRLARRTRKGG